MLDLHLLFGNLSVAANSPLTIYNEYNSAVHFFPDTKLYRALSSLAPTDILNRKLVSSTYTIDDCISFVTIRIPNNYKVVFGPFSAVPYEKLNLQRIESLVDDKNIDSAQIVNYFINFGLYNTDKSDALINLVNCIFGLEPVQTIKPSLSRVDEPDTMSCEPDDVFGSEEYYEAKLFGLIRDGRVELISQFREVLSVSSTEVEYSAEFLRKCKNRLIACLVIARRAAVNGGLNYNTARRVSNFYMSEIERTSGLLSLNRVGAAMFYRFAELVRLCEAGSESSALVNYVNNYIIKHINERITGESIAKQLNMNRTFLCSKFKLETGVSLGERITQMRMNEAKRLLSFKENSILDVAVMLDYSTQSSFHNAFKAHTGVTPGEWRKAHKQNMNMGAFSKFSIMD